MRSIRDLLARPFEGALKNLTGEASEASLQPTREEKFGDYQCNAAMAAAKKLGKNPREVAQQLLDSALPELQGLVEPPELAGPGFINLKLRTDWIEEQLKGFDPGRFERTAPAQTVVVDYSSPNVAKEMHVGHIRSTILGDAIVRILAAGGDKVIRQNHLGDWGTQFGMLCAYMREAPEAAQEVSDLEHLYREANQRFQNDQSFAERARAAVVALHQGDPEALADWEKVLDTSRRHFQPLYRRLGVLLTREDECGESFYRHRLAPLVEELEKRFAAPPEPGHPSLQVRESAGALCAYVYDAEAKPMFLSAEGEALPFIIRKSDGAFLYATTDLAAMRYRVEELKAERIITVVGAPQALHFKMLAATARLAGILPPDVLFEHVAFGSVLGPDRKPLKTRSGGTIKLRELMDEAVERAEALVRANEEDPAKRRGFSEEEVREIAETVGVGAIKYADLYQNRATDYIFSWEKMLAFEGNTAPYLMFGYARLRAILRKAEEAPGEVRLAHPLERSLGLALLRFPETLELVPHGWKINLLADYLYGLAGLVMRFCEECPVLRADLPEERASRLRLCELCANTLKRGLELLGIRVLERM